MAQLRRIAHASISILSVVLLAACGSEDDHGSTSPALLGLPLPGVSDPTSCLVSQPKDPMIAEFVKDSWRVKYPLTRLTVRPNGTIVGSSPPQVIAGHLDLINSVPEARASVARAVAKISGLPDYGMGTMSGDLISCLSVPAWTPSGTTYVATTQNLVNPTTNITTWRKVHAAFAAECPLVRSLLNTDVIDPPGDGSTNAPPSETVKTSGVVANAYGLCPSSAVMGTFCKLSYAEGVNWTGRTCQYYNGRQRCLLY